MKISVKERNDLFGVLATHGYSRTRVRKLVKHGALRVDGQALARADVALEPGQHVEVSRPVASAPFSVLYEDSYLIAVEKPSGVLTVSTGQERSDTFYRTVNEYVWLRSSNKERIFIVHRLDREASGVILFAKSQSIQEALQRGWRGTEKLYCVLVEGHPPERQGTIKTWLRENRIHKVYSADESRDAKHAITHYRVLKKYRSHSLLEIRLETGRKNQIRVHLSELGCPVVGDRRYGASGNPIGRLALHASSLSFSHPVSGNRITLESPIPKVFGDVEKHH